MTTLRERIAAARAELCPLTDAVEPPRGMKRSYVVYEDPDTSAVAASFDTLDAALRWRAKPEAEIILNGRTLAKVVNKKWKLTPAGVKAAADVVATDYVAAELATTEALTTGNDAALYTIKRVLAPVLHNLEKYLDMEPGDPKAVKAGLAQLLGAVGLLCAKLGNPVASKMVHEAAYELVLPKNES